ncbi:MAG: transcription termination factor Rho [Planctomycetia bacterium]|nr:MAG: transcription termination factor Rho [Planctomycetia bacterium]
MKKPSPASDAPRAPDGIAEGVLELGEQGAGFLRDPKRNFAPRPTDAYVSPDAIKRFSLRGGELLRGPVSSVPNKGNRSMRLVRVDQIDGVPVDQWTAHPELSEATAIDPDAPLHFDTPGGPVSMRVVQLFTPIGRGQRGLIVAPPRSGKTILLQQMAHGIAENHPEIYMIVLLIDERPEEVTEMRRNVRGEVYASSNDKDVNSHIRLARLVCERARRLAEAGRHIVILLDSITRLARAFNSFVGSSGRTMTGGLDIRALQEPKQIFGAARNIENGGSLTIIASALVETGSRADDFIFQEFKGTGNMELVLNREMANQRIWPAIDLKQSGTRKEEKLLDEATLRKVNLLRRHLYDMQAPRAMSALLDRMNPHKDLAAFLASLQG